MGTEGHGRGGEPHEHRGGRPDRPASPTSTSRADRDLLLGLLALQNDFIDRDALLAAFATWVADKSRSLGRILLERGALDADTYALLEALLRKHLQRHGDNPGRSLAILSSLGSARGALESVADPDLQASLRLVATVPRAEGDSEATRAHA